ncbi:hypothetical protein RHMOL_Rhmol06G0129700 [Rhododendron molle]|uniref:Uncharacterized protein n=1 Tax=Rhododendron molle TaxID=49168 RepID=A0ACC0NDM2_RHOML|nr:hypothetical protein RHMOL_Rhmol06G0129700 [Rhododendron molle]
MGSPEMEEPEKEELAGVDPRKVSSLVGEEIWDGLGEKMGREERVITGYGVAKVMESGHPNFKKGDLVWGITGWKEYNLVTTPEEDLFKIDQTDVPLSYYTGILDLW